VPAFPLVPVPSVAITISEILVSYSANVAEWLERSLMVLKVPGSKHSLSVRFF